MDVVCKWKSGVKLAFSYSSVDLRKESLICFYDNAYVKRFHPLLFN